MWLLIAVMLVSGHHVKVHVEQFSTFDDCQDRRQAVMEVLEENKLKLLIRIVCEVQV